MGYLSSMGKFADRKQGGILSAGQVTYHTVLFGALPICHEGCAYFVLLVVTGPDRGRMWIDGRASDGGIAPISDQTGRAVTFAQWYGDWLRECFHKLQIGYPE